MRETGTEDEERKREVRLREKERMRRKETERDKQADRHKEVVNQSKSIWEGGLGA